MANRLNKIHFEKKHNLQSFLYRSMRQPSIFINKEKTLVTKTDQRHKGRQQRSKPSRRSPRLWLQRKLFLSIIIWVKLMWNINRKKTLKLLVESPKEDYHEHLLVVMLLWQFGQTHVIGSGPNILAYWQKCNKHLFVRDPENSFGKDPKIYGEEIRTTKHLWFPIWCAT